MSRIEQAVLWAIAIANDPSHGYSQKNRWGPDYDCSSLVIAALEQAGIPAKSKGAANTFTMPGPLMSLGFRNVISEVNLAKGSGLRRGDILWSAHHTGFYIGNGQICHASIDEKGNIVGANKGDQTGREICVRSYYNKPWEAVYRLAQGTEEGVFTIMVNIQIPMIRKGNKGGAVRTLQTMLNAKGFDCGAVDSDFGSRTDHAVRNFQSVQGLEVDGIVGRDTWSALLN